ncbi:OmpP1/FadL family transporter [Hyphococcus lacteus]|uniref:Outer membrane protein transport protein n=1 Tax=Hyphococcus lacteus TaxID=3143536 RepID=A0ABV3Z4I4_9PROT
MYKNVATGVMSFGAALLLTSTSAMASAFALNTQSAEALGAATAGASATQATPGNAYFNPAAIVGVDGAESSFSVIGVFNDTSYENAEGLLFGTVPVAGDTSGEAVIGDGVFPTGAFSTKLSDRVFAGVAIYAPFGFNTSYDDTSVMRYHGTFSQVVSGSISPILGIQIAEGWSLAGGPRLQYLNMDIEGATDAAGAAAALLMDGSVPGTDDSFFDISADDWGFGYSFGLQGTLFNGIQFGVSFTSKIEHDLNGDVDFDISQSTAAQNLALAAGLFQDGPISIGLTTPANIQIGAVVPVSNRARVLASAVQTRWSSFDQLMTDFESPLQPDEIITQNWKNSWSGALGLESDLTGRDTVRFGAMYEDDPANPAFSSPRVPGAKRVWLAAGYSRDLSERAKLNLALSYVLSDELPIDQSGAYPENLFRGSTQADVNINALLIGVGIDWRF